LVGCWENDVEDVLGWEQIALGGFDCPVVAESEAAAFFPQVGT
jgi:hypothetical protein